MTLALPDGWRLWWRADEHPFERWLARRDGLQRWFDATLVSADAGHEPMLWDEHIGFLAEVCRRVAHPSLPRMWATVETAGAHVALAERIPSVSLDLALSITRRGSEPLELSEVVRVVADAADGIEALRRAVSYAHGALDPEHILITESGRGIVRNLWRPGATLSANVTGRVSFVPKVRYLAPEIVRGLPRDARSDVYGLGIALYEALTNARAIDAQTDIEALTKVVIGPPLAPVRDRNAAVPEALDAVIQRAIARDPAARFATTGELSQALAPWRDAAPSKSYRASSATLFERFACRSTKAYAAMVASPRPLDAGERAATWATLRDELCEHLASASFTEDDVIAMTSLRDAAQSDLRAVYADPKAPGDSRLLLARLIDGSAQPRGPRWVRIGLVMVETCEKRWNELIATSPDDKTRYCAACEEHVTLTGSDGALALAEGRRCIRYEPTR